MAPSSERPITFKTPLGFERVWCRRKICLFQPFNKRSILERALTQKAALTIFGGRLFSFVKVIA